MQTNRKISIQILMSAFILSTLTSCNPSGVKETDGDPFPTENDLPQKTHLSQYSIRTTEAADIENPNFEIQEGNKTEEASEVQPMPNLTRTPIPASTATSEPVCIPFPDAIYDILWGEIFARCGTEFISLPLPDPLNDQLIYFWDYTPRTGRIAYGDEKHTLWVFDFWTGSNHQWLDEEVFTAQWSPLSTSESSSQQLAILQADGRLSLVTGPSQITEVAVIGDASHLSWSPNGDTIAYIKDRVLYIIDIAGGQPRKLTEGVSGTPVWALEQEAIIVSAAPFRIARLDGSGTFTPTQPDGTLHSDRPAETMLWWPERRLLTYSDRPHEMDVSGRIWVLELSDDLKTVTWDIAYVDDNIGIDGWWIPGESVIGWGGIFPVIPASEEYFMEVDFDELYLSDDTIWIPGEWIYLRDDTQILDSDGRQLSLTDLKQFSSTTLQAHCRTILRSCLASRIQILDE